MYFYDALIMAKVNVYIVVQDILKILVLLGGFLYVLFCSYSRSLL